MQSSYWGMINPFVYIILPIAHFIVKKKMNRYGLMVLLETLPRGTITVLSAKTLIENFRQFEFTVGIFPPLGAFNALFICIPALSPLSSISCTIVRH